MSKDYRLMQGKSYIYRIRRVADFLEESLKKAKDEEQVIFELDDATATVLQMNRSLRQSFAMRKMRLNNQAEEAGRAVERLKPGPKPRGDSFSRYMVDEKRVR